MWFDMVILGRFGMFVQEVPRFFQRRRNLLYEIFKKREGIRSIIMLTITLIDKARTPRLREMISW